MFGLSNVYPLHKTAKQPLQHPFPARCSIAVLVCTDSLAAQAGPCFAMANVTVEGLQVQPSTGVLATSQHELLDSVPTRKRCIDRIWEAGHLL